MRHFDTTSGPMTPTLFRAAAFQFRDGFLDALVPAPLHVDIVRDFLAERKVVVPTP